jgi:hypothetical protein
MGDAFRLFWGPFGTMAGTLEPLRLQTSLTFLDLDKNAFIGMRLHNSMMMFGIAYVFCVRISCQNAV